MEACDLLEKFVPCLDTGMCRDIKAFLDGENEISKYELRKSGREIIIKITLNKFEYKLSDIIFERFVKFVGYDYLNYFIKEKSKDEIKYVYITAMGNMTGAKMQVLFYHE